MTARPRLGVNIDHVATIRDGRGGRYPDPPRAARIAAEAGADGITAHPREDRRHITDGDIERPSEEIDLPLDLEMAATPEMLAIALRPKPHAVCLVPEKRREPTTEGGLDAAAGKDHLASYVTALGEAVFSGVDGAIKHMRALMERPAPAPPAVAAARSVPEPRGPGR